MKNLAKRYLGEWVSVSRDYKKVFAHSARVGTLVEEIESKNIKNSVIIRIPTKIPTAYAG
jgi:hypothetical protein